MLFHDQKLVSFMFSNTILLIAVFTYALRTMYGELCEVVCLRVGYAAQPAAISDHTIKERKMMIKYRSLSFLLSRLCAGTKKKEKGGILGDFSIWERSKPNALILQIISNRPAH